MTKNSRINQDDDRERPHRSASPSRSDVGCCQRLTEHDGESKSTNQVPEPIGDMMKLTTAEIDFGENTGNVETRIITIVMVSNTVHL